MTFQDLPDFSEKISKWLEAPCPPLTDLHSLRNHSSVPQEQCWQLGMPLAVSPSSDCSATNLLLLNGSLNHEINSSYGSQLLRSGLSMSEPTSLLVDQLSHQPTREQLASDPSSSFVGVSLNSISTTDTHMSPLLMPTLDNFSDGAMKNAQYPDLSEFRASLMTSKIQNLSTDQHESHEGVTVFKNLSLEDLSKAYHPYINSLAENLYTNDAAAQPLSQPLVADRQKTHSLVSEEFVECVPRCLATESARDASSSSTRTFWPPAENDIFQDEARRDSLKNLIAEIELRKLLIAVMNSTDWEGRSIVPAFSDTTNKEWSGLRNLNSEASQWNTLMTMLSSTEVPLDSFGPLRNNTIVSNGDMSRDAQSQDEMITSRQTSDACATFQYNDSALSVERGQQLGHHTSSDMMNPDLSKSHNIQSIWGSSIRRKQLPTVIKTDLRSSDPYSNSNLSHYYHPYATMSNCSNSTTVSTPETSPTLHSTPNASLFQINDNQLSSRPCFSDNTAVMPMNSGGVCNMLQFLKDKIAIERCEQAPLLSTAEVLRSPILSGFNDDLVEGRYYAHPRTPGMKVGDRPREKRFPGRSLSLDLELDEEQTDSGSDGVKVLDIQDPISRVTVIPVASQSKVFDKIKGPMVRIKGRPSAKALRRKLERLGQNRGSLELDRILGTFAKSYVPIMTYEQLIGFEEILSIDNPTIFGILSGQYGIPKDLNPNMALPILLHFINPKHPNLDRSCLLPPKTAPLSPEQRG